MRTYNFKIFFIFFILLSIASCKDKSYEITQLNTIQLPEESEVFRIEYSCYSNGFIVDSFLIMTSDCSLDRDSVEKKIHVYDKRNLLIITKFGTGGLARFELPDVCPLTSIQKSDNMFFYDRTTWHFKTINLDNYLLEGNVGICISSVPMDRDLFFSLNLIQLNNHKFAGINRSDALRKKGMFFIYDTLTHEKKYIDYKPKANVDQNHLKFLYSGCLTVNNIKEIFLFATSYYDQVLFYDFEGNLLKQHVFSPLTTPPLSRRYDGPEFPGSYVYANEVYATSQYFFLTRLGTRHPQPLAPQLLVFNWDGSFIQAFDFSAEVSKFFYDEEFGYLYTLQSSQEENDPYVTVRKYKIGDYF